MTENKNNKTCNFDTTYQLCYSIFYKRELECILYKFLKKGLG